MNRRPTYTKDGLWRVVSCPKGLWRLQKLSDRKGDKVLDPWDGHGPATTFQEAMAQLNAQQPVPKGSAA